MTHKADKALRAAYRAYHANTPRHSLRDLQMADLGRRIEAQNTIRNAVNHLSPREAIQLLTDVLTTALLRHADPDAVIAVCDELEQHTDSLLR